MALPDDSSLGLADLRTVEARARHLLDRADAWDRFPVPIDELLAAANVRVATIGAFDPAALVAYIRGRTAEVALHIKSAISKVLGIYDVGASVIHVDESVVQPKQTFLKLHETAHHDLPVHRRSFGLFQDCDQTLAPEVADQFEREANNYARFVLFKGSTFADRAVDYPLAIRTPIRLAKEFGASVYAGLREYVRTNRLPCMAVILNSLEAASDGHMAASIRRVEASPAWLSRFGLPTSNHPISPRHLLWPAVPVGRKMTSPTPLSLPDKNGDPQVCLAEALDTTYNILILVYVDAL